MRGSLRKLPRNLLPRTKTTDRRGGESPARTVTTSSDTRVWARVTRIDRPRVFVALNVFIRREVCTTFNQ